MYLVEQHIITPTDSRFGVIDAAAFAAKNLYNAVNYRVRQSFIRDGVYLNYHAIHCQMKDTEQYQALPPDHALGRRNNRNVVQVPHARFIVMLQYKADLVGIAVRTINESHTSTCSFPDGEPIGHREHYVGKRIMRGMFRAADGRRINADINAAYNIIRKAIPNAFGNGIGGVVVHPVGMAPTN